MHLTTTIAAGMVATAALAASAVPGAGAAAPKASPPAGAVLAGATSKGWPAFVELSRNGRRIVAALAALRLTCKPSGNGLTVPDGWRLLPVSATGAFRGDFVGMPEDLGDGRRGVFESHMTGKVNARRTLVTGTWRAVLTISDAAGTVVDTCDSGATVYRLRQ